MTLADAQQRFNDRLVELPILFPSGSPWVFLCASALVEYLAKLVDGADNGGRGYKNFVRNWLSAVRPSYLTFRYLAGQCDLPEQMYHVLRCGVVHNLSLIPTPRARNDGGRDRSIALCHRAEAQQRSLTHLGNYNTPQIADAAIFVAEDFVEDLGQVVARVFASATPGSTLEANMTSWLNQYPLLRGGF